MCNKNNRHPVEFISSARCRQSVDRFWMQEDGDNDLIEPIYLGEHLMETL